MATATLHLPSTAKDISLVYKYTNAAGVATIVADSELFLDLAGGKVEGVNTIAKFLASKTKPELLGASKETQSEVDEWLSWAPSAFKGASSKEINAAIQKLNGHLLTRTFIAGNTLSLADLIVFGSVYAVYKNVNVKTAPNVLRWLDLIQNTAVKQSNATEEFPLLDIDLNNVPEPVIAAAKDKADKKGDKKGDKADKKQAEGKKEEKAAEEKKEGGKKEGGNKDKKDKKEKKEKKPAAPAAEEPEQPVVSRLDIRVGYIRSCRKHEGADSLYVEEIDLGDGEGVYRTIVSGLVRWYPLEEMQNRWVLCLANLKPAAMRGIKSEGMVLCATAPDGSKVELLTPVDTSKVKPGDRVFFEGLEGTPEKVLPPKKKYWETVQPDFKTKEDTIAYFQDKPFLIKSSSGELVKCKVATVQNGGIK